MYAQMLKKIIYFLHLCGFPLYDFRWSWFPRQSLPTMDVCGMCLHLRYTDSSDYTLLCLLLHISALAISMISSAEGIEDKFSAHQIRRLQAVPYADIESKLFGQCHDSHHVVPKNIMDKAWLTVVSNLEKNVSLFAQVSICDEVSKFCQLIIMVLNQIISNVLYFILIIFYCFL